MSEARDFWEVRTSPTNFGDHRHRKAKQLTPNRDLRPVSPSAIEATKLLLLLPLRLGKKGTHSLHGCLFFRLS